MAAESEKVFWLGASSRVGAEIGLGRWQSEYVTVKTSAGATWRLQISPCDARGLARRLKRAADYLDPPKPRKAKP